VKSAKGLLWFFACLFCLLPTSLPAQYEIEAQVDKNEVAFGESLSLVISITHHLGNGGIARSLTPNIGEIPGFDIASTRTSHSSRWVNGVGVTISQVLLELVPQEPGKKEIPAISFKDPEGNMHSTEPIEINVLPPQVEPDTAEKEAGPADKRSEGGSFFRLILAGGMALFILLAIPLIFFVWSGKKSESKPQTMVEDAKIVAVVEESKAQKHEPKLDFNGELARLKRQSPEVDGEFYREFFSLFKRAAVQRTAGLSEDLTPDEMLAKIKAMSGNESVKRSAERVGADIELVMYAGGLPERSFSAIEEDVKTVLHGID